MLRPPPDEVSPAQDRAGSPARRRTLALLWAAYAAHYLCRVNLAAAQSDLVALMMRGRARRPLPAAYAAGGTPGPSGEAPA